MPAAALATSDAVCCIMIRRAMQSEDLYLFRTGTEDVRKIRATVFCTNLSEGQPMGRLELPLDGAQYSCTDSVLR